MSYDTFEAARLISWSNKQAGIGPLTEAELVQWIDEGVGGLEWEDIWEEDGEVARYIDFPTLISLRLICLLHFDIPRTEAISLKEITTAAGKLRKELGVEWPFARKVLWDLHDKRVPASASSSGEGDSKYHEADWKRDYWKLWGHRCLPSTEASLNYGDDGVACAWLPAEDIKIDPNFVSGSPCLAGTRIPTWVFPGMRAGGDSIEELADDYDITKERVELALEWERQLANVGI